MEPFAPDSPPDGTDLRDVLRPIWSHKLLIVLVVVVATAATYFVVARQADTFESSTQIYLRQSEADQFLNPGTDLTTDRTVQNQATLLQSERIAGQVAKSIGYRGAPSVLRNELSVSADEGKDFITLTAMSTSPKQAADVANGFAKAYETLSSAGVTAGIRKNLATAQQQLRAIVPTRANVETRTDLAAQVRRFRAAARLSPSTVEQVDSAPVPTTPVAPRPERQALFAFALSLFFALAAAVGLDRVDRRIRRPEDVEPAYGVPVLATVPYASDTGSLVKDGATLGEHVKEPFRALRAGIRLARVDDPIRTLLVTSATPGEGKSTVVRNLALSYSEMGGRVLVVEFDLRRPTLNKLFGVEPQRGLTDYLIGDCTLQDAILHPATTVDDVASIVHQGEGGAGPIESNASAEGGVSLLLRGSHVPNPAAVLASEGTVDLIEKLKGDFDIVIFDTAPIVAVSDAVPLLDTVDGVLLVSRLDKTTRDDVRRLRQLLGRVQDVNTIGVVANGLSAFESGRLYGNRYGYGGKNGYGYASSQASK